MFFFFLGNNFWKATGSKIHQQIIHFFSQDPLYSTYSSLASAWTPLIFYSLQNFAFSGMSYSCNHTICRIFRLAFEGWHFKSGIKIGSEDPDAGKDWRQKKRAAEDEMVGWHHEFKWHESEQTLGDSERQGSLQCCSPWGHKDSDTTQWLNNKCFFMIKLSGFLPSHTAYDIRSS